MKAIVIGLSSILVLVALPFSSRAQGHHAWSQFRGPGRTGVSAERGLLRSWPEAGPEIHWRRPIGSGLSGFAIAGDFFYTLLVEGEEEFLAGFRVADGTEIWRLGIGEPFTDEFGAGPRSTPTIHGELVYALGGRGRLVAACTDSGESVWEVDLFETYGCYEFEVGSGGPTGDNVKKVPNWGYAASPLVDSDVLLIGTGAGNGKSFVALDPRTGEERWSVLDSIIDYSSPTAITLGGRRQFLIQAGPEVVGVSPEGEIYWRQPWSVGIAQPTFLPPDRIFVSSFQGNQAMVFQVTTDGPKITTETLWTNPRMRNYWNSSVVWAGHIYGFDNATLRCLSAETGEMRWAKRGLGKGNLLASDGLLFIYSDQGLLVLAEASPEGFQEKGRLRVFEESRTWTPPALADGRLYLRGPHEIVNLKVRD